MRRGHYQEVRRATIMAVSVGGSGDGGEKNTRFPHMGSEQLVRHVGELRERVGTARKSTERYTSAIGHGELIDELSAAVEELDLASGALLEADRQVGLERQRYRDLFDLCPDVYLIVDLQGVIVDANRSASRMLGLPPAALIGKPLPAYLEPEGSDRLRRQLAAVAEGRPGADPDWEAGVRSHSGAAWRAWIRAEAEGDPAGLPAGMRLLMRDITDRARLADRERGQHRREEARLRSYGERMEALEKTKADLLRLLSHELGTPVALIRGYVAMITDGSLGDVGPRVSDVLPIVMRRCDEIAHLVEQMVEVARLEEPRLHLDLRLEDLADLAARAVAQMEPMAEIAGKGLRLEVTSEPLPVRVDAGRVGTILTNLIGNALKYSTPGSEVVCETGGGGAAATVAIRDQGPGIARSQLGTLFTKFGRLTTPETAHIRGTGFGLYLCRELSRLLGGELQVDSVEGVGSTFTLSLPMVPLEAAGGAAVAAAGR
jgi:PAS domain S-box-containing protein